MRKTLNFLARLCMIVSCAMLSSQSFAGYSALGQSSSSIQVLKERERLRILIPIDPYFNLRTLHSNYALLSAMPNVVSLLRRYPSKKPIVVMAYTDAVHGYVEQRRRGYVLANHLSALLWQQGISDRRLVRFVVIPKHSGSMYRRVEILLGDHS